MLDSSFIFGEELDKLFSWRPGTAVRLARRRQLPFVLLPDGGIAFDKDAIGSLIVRVPAVKMEGAPCRKD